MTSHSLVVEAREQPAPGIALITFRGDDDEPLPAAPPGSHINVHVPLHGAHDVRSYSLVDLGAEDGRWRIAVRLQQDGRGGSRWMHELAPGDRLQSTSPIDGFPVNPGERPGVLLAAGIGITPVLGLARALQRRRAAYQLWYLGRSRAQMAFVDHLAAAHADRLRVHESDADGELDPAAIVADVPADGVLYVCGPVGLLAAIQRAWAGEGRAAADLRFETFGTSGSRPSRAFRAIVPRHGVEVEVPVGATLLDALEEAGVEVLYDCRRGECGLCRVRVLTADGTVDHRDVFLSDRQKREGDQLCACVSRLDGETMTIEA